MSEVEHTQSARNKEVEDLKNNLIMLQVEKMALEITARIDKLDQSIRTQLERGEQRMNDMEQTLMLKAEHAELLEHRKLMHEQAEEHKKEMKKITDETELSRVIQKRPKLAIFIVIVTLSLVVTDVREALLHATGLRNTPIVSVETLDKKIDIKFADLGERLTKLEDTNDVLRYIKEHAPEPTK